MARATTVILKTILLAATAASTSIYAQSAEPVSGLEDVIVTAQRKSENLQDVPLSVAAVRGDALGAITSSGQDVRALSARVPSLQVEGSFGRTFPRFYIRGLGNTDFDLNASQPVSLVYDDVVLENPVLKGFPIFDMDRVEVLRGPQGTLFGRNTPAGIVKFESKKPTEELDGYARVSFGRFDNLNMEAAVGGALADSASVRFSMLYQRQDDWVTNTFQRDGRYTRRDSVDSKLEGFDELAFRGQLLIKPAEDLSFLISGQIRSLDGTARLFRANIIQRGTNNFTSAYRRDQVSVDGANNQSLNTKSISGTVTYDFGPATLTSVTALYRGSLASVGDIDGGFGASFLPPFGPGFIPFPAETEDRVPKVRQVTHETRIASSEDGPLGYQAGFFYFDENLEVDSLNYATFTGANDIRVFQDQKSKAYGVFASLSYKLGDQLTLTGGLRYNDDKRNYVARRTLGFLGPRTETARVSDSSITWDASATYALSDDVNLYARVAKGYRAPSVQGRILFANGVSTAKSEFVYSYEAGLKSTLADGRVRFNANGFYYDAKDLQLTAVGGGVNFARLLNTDARGYGFEAELEAAPADPVRLTAGISYNNTRIKDDIQSGICGSGCTVLDPTIVVGGVTLANIRGNSLPNAPRWTLNATARYAIPFGDGEVFAFTDWAYRSRVNFFLYESAEYNDARMLEGGLRIGYQGADEKYEVAAFVRNITNDNSLVGGIDFNNLTGFVNEPRVWGVSAQFKF
jgi:iron complex outermembrane receptor protein